MTKIRSGAPDSMANGFFSDAICVNLLMRDETKHRCKFRSQPPDSSSCGGLIDRGEKTEMTARKNNAGFSRPVRVASPEQTPKGPTIAPVMLNMSNCVARGPERAADYLGNLLLQNDPLTYDRVISFVAQVFGKGLHDIV